MQKLGASRERLIQLKGLAPSMDLNRKISGIQHFLNCSATSRDPIDSLNDQQIYDTLNEIKELEIKVKEENMRILESIIASISATYPDIEMKIASLANQTAELINLRDETEAELEKVRIAEIRERIRF